MKFNDLDNKMRVYEQSLDQVIVPETFLIARLDGRGFTKLTKEVCKFEAPFDVRFRDLMVDTTKHLMDSGIRVVYGYTESDEISLLFHQEESAFGRKVRKFNSILAGEASAFFSMQLGKLAVFDCRIIPLPNEELVRDYFRWRQEDANRNALNALCYWMLRKNGLKPSAANSQIKDLSVVEKTELLFAHGINYNDLPAWHKRGCGMTYEMVEKIGFNPLTGQNVTALRRELKVDVNLPIGNDYGEMIGRIIKTNTEK